VAAVRAVVSMGMIVAVAGAAACGHGGPASPDGAAQPVGFDISWATDPAIPGLASPSLRIDSATFQLDHVRLVGDAGTGDDHTTRDDVELTWNASTTTPDLSFPDAPPGLYSQIQLGIDGKVDHDSYAIDGAVQLDGDWIDFSIWDQQELAITIPFGFTLAPGTAVGVPIEIELASALSAIDFAACDDGEGGKKILDNNDEQMPALRQALLDAFVVADEGRARANQASVISSSNAP
jgi:hypothetical protein